MCDFTFERKKSGKKSREYEILSLLSFDGVMVLFHSLSRECGFTQLMLKIRTFTFFFFQPNIYHVFICSHTDTRVYKCAVEFFIYFDFITLFIAHLHWSDWATLFDFIFTQIDIFRANRRRRLLSFQHFHLWHVCSNVCVIVEGNICFRPLFMGFYRPKKALKSKVYLLSSFFFFPFGVCVTVSTDNPLEYTHTFKFTFGSSFIGKI